MLNAHACMTDKTAAFRIRFTASFFLMVMLLFLTGAEALTTPAARSDSVSAKGAAAGSSSSNIKRIVFGEQKIEGKIRRPQLVLIKADQRPEFQPMVLQTLGKTRNIAGLVDESLIEPPNKGAFQFKGTSIINPEP